MDTPFYRLKQLILQKYGEEKFATGCALVAWFVSYETKLNHNQHWVEVMCDIKEEDVTQTFRLKANEANALKGLFKLESWKELYTLPETAPAILT